MLNALALQLMLCGASADNVDLRCDPPAGYLRVHYHTSDHDGPTITDVHRGSAAKVVGMREGDVIVAFGGRSMIGSRSLAVEIARTKPGAVVSVVIRREWKVSELQVKIAGPPPQRTWRQRDGELQERQTGVVEEPPVTAP